MMSSKQTEKYCVLDSNCKDILGKIINKLGLSARAYGKILKLARTIADLDNEQDIKVQHQTEAIQYRTLDRDKWNM